MKSESVCQRCGIKTKTETDRIKPGVEGGEYIEGNTRELCPTCHQLRHKVREITERVIFESDPNRIEVYLRRLEIILRENTPLLVRNRQSYQSYWEFEQLTLPTQRKEYRLVPQIYNVPRQNGG